MASSERESYKIRWGLNEERAGKLVADIGALIGKGLADLHEMLPGVRFNHYGLLKHTFEETAAFSDRIQGYGESVLWVPCRIGKCI